MPTNHLTNRLENCIKRLEEMGSHIQETRKLIRLLVVAIAERNGTATDRDIYEDDS